MRSYSQIQKSGEDEAALILFVVLAVSLLCVPNSTVFSDAASLDAQEATALRAIAKELGKQDWNFSVDPCSKSVSWNPKTDPNNHTYVNNLTCTCYAPHPCHVTGINLKGQDLAGVLPLSLAKLRHLEHIDLSRNYLHGSIPQEWESLKGLQYLSLMVNRLSGLIPAYLGNMTGLTYLSIENNMFRGPVPPELGKLVKLQSLSLTANNLTGQLPKALTNLFNLSELRIGSNNFGGKLPDYFLSWTALQTLEIQGSGFSGPIPSSFANLTALVEIRISDLHGEGSDFPQVGNMADLKYLMLRNCNISGSIPSYLANLNKKLRTLDLSFNNLVGPIPDELNHLDLDNMYLTKNFLNGSISDWIKNIKDDNYIDLSYNNLNSSSLPSSCDKENLNLFRSSSRDLNSPLAACLDRNFPCLNKKYSLHIDCGGNGTKVGDTNYEADDDSSTPAKFKPSKAEWGYSNTGHFLSTRNTSESAKSIETNDTVLPVTNANLYTQARISAISLTYYGRCLVKGNYTIVLYFAELRFTNDNSFRKLGRRLFDIYIQEKLVKSNFDIVSAASGAEKACNVTVRHVSVTETGTIEIRFYYAGKGTTGVPIRGTYGPLISAISVKSEFSPPTDKKRIITVVVGFTASFIFLGIIAYYFSVWWRRERSFPSREEVLKGIDLQTGVFTYWQIKAATDNFDPHNKIGEGGFGSVYKGTLLDGTCIAVKQLSSKSSQGNKEFVTEVGMISGLHHPNLVKLYGCCVEGAQLFLVYEYMVNNNLARALFDENWPLRLDWPTRQKVCTDLARGLVFLHEDSTIKIIHRDIKPTNVLLDENLNAKISDFGLARLREEENTHISTRVAGTIGYMSPEYALWGYLTYKADVYSFGVVALEIVAGRSNMDFVPDEDNFCLLDCAVVQQERGELMGMIDAKLGDEYKEEEAVRMIKIALLCTKGAPALRPTMSQVVRMLEGDLSVEDLASDQQLTHQTEPAEFVSETQSLIHSSDAPLTGYSS